MGAKYYVWNPWTGEYTGHSEDALIDEQKTKLTGIEHYLVARNCTLAIPPAVIDTKNNCLYWDDTKGAWYEAPKPAPVGATGDFDPMANLSEDDKAYMKLQGEMYLLDQESLHLIREWIIKQKDVPADLLTKDTEYKTKKAEADTLKAKIEEVKVK